MIEIIFPSHENVNEQWAFRALACIRCDWLDDRGLRYKGSDLKEDHDSNREQWFYIAALP